MWVMSQSVIPQLIELADGSGAPRTTWWIFLGTRQGHQRPAACHPEHADACSMQAARIYFTEMLPALGTSLGDVLLIDPKAST